jgi:hypothetical protein
MNLIKLLLLSFTTLLVACSSSPSLTPLPYTDNFDNPASGWKTAKESALRIQYQAGGLRFSIDDLDQIAWSMPGRRFENFTLDVDATQLDGPNDNSYGVIVRYVDDKNFYRLDISGDGYYAITKRKDGAWIKVQDWIEAEAIHKEKATNHLQVVAKGNQFAFNINGQPVATFSDGDFKQGDIGLTTGTLFDNAGVQIAFDNLTVSEVKP